MNELGVIGKVDSVDDPLDAMHGRARLPAIIGFTIGSWAGNASQKSSLLYTPELKITAIQDFEPTPDADSWRKIGLTSGKTIYFKTNRLVNLLSGEQQKAADEVIDLINNEYSAKRVPIMDKDTQVQKGIKYIVPSYGGTAVDLSSVNLTVLLHGNLVLQCKHAR